MKHETKVSDLRVLLAKTAADTAHTKAHGEVGAAATSTSTTAEYLLAKRAAYMSAVHALADADAALKKLPLARRDQAIVIANSAKDNARSVAHMGDAFSGTYAVTVEWGDSASACSATDAGSQYSQRCKYRKTDVNHVIVLDPAGAVLLHENPGVVRASSVDGLPLIALYPDDTAVWVTVKRGKLHSEKGWVLFNDGLCFHSTKSRADCERGLARKLRQQEAQRKIAAETAKQQRRYRLITRLCPSVKITLADAKELNYCDPGIRAFQSRFNIGDTASLPDLVKTGDPSAVRLALHVARKVSLSHQ